MDKVADAVWLAESVTVAVNVAVPVDNGVPEMTPVLARVRSIAARLVAPAESTVQE
jgi:hypothetical protein